MKEILRHIDYCNLRRSLLLTLCAMIILTPLKLFTKFVAELKAWRHPWMLNWNFSLT
jgi:hypothetical protein